MHPAFPCIAALLVVAGTSHAQEKATLAPPKQTYELTFAAARNQPLKTRMATTHDRDLYLVTLRMRRTLAAGSKVELAYIGDLIPAAMSTRMPVYKDVGADCPKEPEPCVVPLYLRTALSGQVSAYGAGISPLGAGLRFTPARGLALVARGSVGIIQFSRPVPDPGETRLNFNLDAGTSAEVGIGRGMQLVAGYRINHISNGGRGRVNPGMDSRLLELGLSVAR